MIIGDFPRNALRAIVVIVLGVSGSNALDAAHKSVESGPRSKVTIIASGAEIAFFILSLNTPASV